MLNNQLDREKLKQEFAKEGRLRIEDFLAPEFAIRIAEYAPQHIPFKIHCSIDGKNQSISQAEMAAKSNEEKRSMNTKILSAASKGEGFLYCGYKRSDSKESKSKELLFLHELFDFINSDEVLSLIHYITGNDKINKADAHYTRYTPGQFLTRHQDIIAGKNRRFAYVLGFTPSWHPDWGGLLQFYLPDGTPEETWAPKFNTLTLFDTKYIHAVSCVAPFAIAPRISLTGWFQDLPLTEESSTEKSSTEKSSTEKSSWSVKYDL